MSLSSLFPEEFKEGFAKRNLKIGSVIKVFVTDTHPPKEKRLILVGVSYDKLLFASVFINSEINMRIFHTQELLNLNLQLDVKDRDYIDRPSHVDCSEIKKRDAKWLSQLVSEDPARVLGEVSEVDLQQIRLKIKSAKTISPAIKKTFGLYL
jgi:hypothetical protein